MTDHDATHDLRSHPHPDPDDSRCAPELLWEFVERARRGEPLDEDRIRERLPDLADEVLRQLEAFREIGDAGNVVEEEALASKPLGSLGDYRLVRQIGRGGMGVVYEAWEASTDRAVALKVLPAGVAADDRAFQRFLREAKAAGKLSHPSVVPVYFTGMKEQTPFYAMELVEGETLAQIIARLQSTMPESSTPFGPKDCAGFFESLARAFADVADGLQHAHSKGVTHRDIKPSNLILDRDARLRVLDFGLALLEGQDALTLSGDFLGTPLYMSPEQARRRKTVVDHRTDIYSLGATMYELVCGRPPFQGHDHADTLSQIVERDPVEPRRLNARVPKALETIVLKCLRKDPDERYGTAEALGQDLQRFARGDPIEARTETFVDRVARRVARHRVGLVTAAVLGLVGMLAVVLHSVAVSQERDLAVHERDRAESTLYVARMLLAQRDWEAGNMERLTRTLADYVPGSERGDEIDRRGWEWYYLHELPRRGLLRELPGTVVQWSPDGRRVAATGSAGEYDTEAVVWDVETGEEVLRVDHESSAIVATFSPDGARLATYGWSGPLTAVRVWDATTGALLETLASGFREEANSHVRHAAWHPDGRRIALASQLGAIEVWDAETGERLQTLIEAQQEPEPVWHLGSQVAWSPDGRRLVRCRRGEMVIVEADGVGSWREIARRTTETFRESVGWSPDGSLLGVSGDGELAFWTGDGKQKLGSVLGLDGVERFDWSLDGQRIACGLLDGATIVIDVATRQIVHRLRGHSDHVWNAYWQPVAGSSVLATTGRDRTVRIWDLSLLDREAIPAILPKAFDWSRDGRLLAVLEQLDDHESIAIRDLAQDRDVARLELRGWPRDSIAADLQLSVDGHLIAASAQSPEDPERSRLGVFDWRRGEMLWESSGVGQVVKWRPQGDLLASAEGREIVLRGVRDGQDHVRLREHRRRVCDIAWRADGLALAGASNHHEIVVWSSDVRTKEAWRPAWRRDLNALDPYPVFGGGASPLAWSPDGRILAAAGGPGVLWLFDAETGDALFRERGHVAALVSLDWSPDGRRIASCGRDRKVRVWGLDSGESLDQLLVVSGELGDLCHVAWHPDGHRLAALVRGDAIRAWDAPGYEAAPR